MDDALFVDEVDSVNDLQHIFNHLPLSQLEVLVDDSLKQLAAWDPAKQQQRHRVAEEQFQTQVVKTSECPSERLKQ